MNNIKRLILVSIFICCSCAKKNNAAKSVSLEEAPIETEEKSIRTEFAMDKTDLEPRNDVSDNFNINHTLILQKINELIELNQLKQEQNNFTPEIDQQIFKLTKNPTFLDSLPKNTTITQLKYLSKVKRINDSTEIIDFSFHTEEVSLSLTASIISSKKVINNTTYNNQQITFKTKE